MPQLASQEMYVAGEPLPPPDLSEILMRVVDALLEQGWAPAAIAKDMHQVANLVQVMDRARGLPQ